MIGTLNIDGVDYVVIPRPSLRGAGPSFPPATHAASDPPRQPSST